MIKRLRIKNLKSLHDTGDCALGMLTLLTGINGRGKSSFLQSLLLLSQSLRESNGSPLFLYPNGDWCELGMFSDIQNVFAPSESLQIEFDTDAAFENSFVCEYLPSYYKVVLGEAKSIKVDGYETIEDSEESSSDDFNDPIEQSLPKVRTTYGDLKELQKLKNLYFISADRQAAKSEDVIDDSKYANYIGAHGQRVLNVLNKCSDEQIVEVESLMNNILDGATLRIKRDVDNNKIYLYLDSVANGKMFRPINVGFGYSFIISTILAMVLSQSGDTIIIENPEAHLHPQAQSRLMKAICGLIRTKNVQFFIESHSDHIVNASLLAIKQKENLCRKDVEILYFSMNNDPDDGSKVENLKLTDNGRVMMPPRGFCDQYAMDLRAIMRPSYADAQTDRKD